MQSRSFSAFRILANGVIFASLQFFCVQVAAQTANHPSSHCHVTDGSFTACSDGSTEWSDVQPTFFPASDSYLYVNQNASRTALFLMYDLPFRTTQLAPSESVRVSFDTVEVQSTGSALEHYDVDIFGDGHIQVLVFGQPEAPGNIVGAVGFNASPNSSLPHVVAELQVPLVPGGATVYSPNPIFWSSTIPPTPPPPPPPPGTKTEQQKRNLFQLADAKDLLADSVAVIGTLTCALAPSLPLKLACIAYYGGLVIVIKQDARKLRELARNDPPVCSDFTVIPQPVLKTLSIQPITTVQGVTQQEADGLNALLTNLEQDISFEEAATGALGCAQAAQSAGNSFWEAQQVQAVKQYESQLAVLFNAAPGLLANLGNAFQAAGLRLTFNVNDVLNLQSLVSSNGLPSAYVQALIDLGADPAAQTDILISITSADPNAVASLGVGTFPQLLADPTVATALQQAGTALNQEAETLPTDSLVQSLSVTIAGDYTAAGVGLRGLSSGTITISGIPTGANIVKAFLYWGMLDTGEDPSLKSITFNGVPVTGTRVGSGPDTCWGRTNSFSYRAEVTPFVSGNGTYNLTGVAVGGNILAEGASLVVLYQNPGGSVKTIILQDGDVVFPAVSVGTTTFAGFAASGPVSAMTTFLVGDGQAQQFNLFTPVSFTGSLGTINFTGLFSSNNGPLWDTDTFDVSPVIGPGNFPASAKITLAGDCLMWVGQAFSVTTTSAPLAPVRATASVVQANENLDTTVKLRGLSPADEPTLQDKITMIVQDRVIRDPSISVADLTSQLVNSLPSTVLPPDQASSLKSAILKQTVLPPVPFAQFQAKLEISPGGFELNATFSLGANSGGINPVTEAVTLQVGTLSVTIPAGSFAGTRDGSFVFEGAVNGVGLEVRINPLGNNSFAFQAEGESVNLTALRNPVTVVLTIGNALTASDTGTTAVSAEHD